MNRKTAGTKRPSGPKALFLLLLLGGVCWADDLWPSALDLPLFAPAPELAFGEPAEYDSLPSPYVPTIGELKTTLVYHEGYVDLFVYMNESVIPHANELAEDYNHLLSRYKLLLVCAGVTTTALLTVVALR